MLCQLNIFLILLLASTHMNGEEMSDSKQYNGFADKYSEIFVENNQDSIAAYYRYFDFSLQGKKVLDLGCGDGYDLEQMNLKGASIYGIDASEEMICIAKEKNHEGDIRVGTFEKIPFPDNIFDVVISKWAFQTSANIDPIYKEICRVLKPGGKLIYLTGHPTRQFMEKKREEQELF